ncbi:unnamed protein product, partial [Cladocopium goreaui]
MRTEAAKFCSVSKQTSLESSLCKKEKWLSEKQALDKWGQADLDKHLESGRVVYRQEEDAWDQLLGKDLIGLLSEQGPGKGAPAKGNGKGKAKSKTKSQPPQPALEDMSTEEQLHE